MSDDNKSIQELDLICEYYGSLERQGPGSVETTLKALSFIEGLNHESKVVDLGCGTGGQTMVLAKHLQGEVIGVDMFPKFITLFNDNAHRYGLSSRVKGEVGSMDQLPFAKSSLDLIWSEGAIYNIGFKNGLTYWRSFLKKGGYVVASEISWFTEERPKEIQEFWNSAYPEIDTIPNKIAQMQQAGYVPVATFIIPVDCWTENFYYPQHEVQEVFLERYHDNEWAKEFIQSQREEEMLYNKYRDFYGYVFYIGKKM
ncbi:class I SAM-dependent methyltransferase [Halosquirtibacter xylanolyticus]|uniref:class I SAM-dependent methyltransferase n=1 Tax=Halosquirtibacter xylanolyticus TaxID=3374599 RepID=UPI003749FC79|nr:class I SAM-dependent methyltransferase [Prolixibacteraceae bacterium]